VFLYLQSKQDRKVLLPRIASHLRLRLTRCLTSQEPNEAAKVIGNASTMARVSVCYSYRVHATAVLEPFGYTALILAVDLLDIWGETFWC